MTDDIKIDYSRDSLFDALGMLRLKESYMMDNEVSPQERFAFVSKAFGSNPEHAQRLYDYSSNHWLSYATPILSFGRSRRGLPISCYLSALTDSSEGLVDTMSEVSWLSMMGGGIGIGVGIRSADEKSVGVMPHLKAYDASSLAYRQGRTRRGSYAAYLDISHPDILLFLEMRKPTGDPNIRTPNLHHGINISDAFMHIIERCMLDPDADDSWELKDPHNQQVREKVSAKELWQRILETRMQTGEPYLLFIDTVNRAMHPAQKELGFKITQSNLCSEIVEFSNSERTAVCCLSSLNLEYFDKWKNNKEFIPDVVEMLDNVLEYFIQNAPDTIKRARFSAESERSIGIGALGFHAYLQQHGIPWESALAKSANLKIFKHIKKEINGAELILARKLGEAPDLISDVIVIDENDNKIHLRSSDWITIHREGGKDKTEIRSFDLEDGDILIKIPHKKEEYLQIKSIIKKPWAGTRRHTHSSAIAPNATSSLVMGNTSPSVEPYRANAYRQDTISGSHITKNKYLNKIIQEKCNEDSKLDYQEIWGSIISNDGSVQGLDFLSEYERETFKTSMELDQRWVVEHAADRQDFLDQSQSLNLFFRPDVDIKYLHAVHFLAWARGLKSLYYCRSEKLAKADKVSRKIERQIIAEIDLKAIARDGESCLACE